MARAALLVSLAAPALAAGAGKVKQIACGDSGSDATNVNLGAFDYFATLNGVGNSSTGNTFSLTATFKITPSGFGCDPHGVTSSFVGNGKGDHKYHEVVLDRATLTQTVTDRETSYDWILRAETGTCDYIVKMDWAVACAAAPAPTPPAPPAPAPHGSCGQQVCQLGLYQCRAPCTCGGIGNPMPGYGHCM